MVFWRLIQIALCDNELSKGGVFMKENRSINEIQPLLETRRALFSLLRQTFITEPTPEYLQTIIKEIDFNDFPFSDMQEEIRDGAKLVAEFCAEHDLERADTHDALHWEFTRMFIGPDKLPAPPWESAYLHKDKLLFQEHTLKVRQAYLKYQLLPANYLKEADDHLGLELDFMYQLTTFALEALEDQKFAELREILLDQKDFLENHLLKWVSEFSSNISESANHSFYPGMGKILVGYLQLDLEAIDELLDIVSSCV